MKYSDDKDVIPKPILNQAIGFNDGAAECGALNEHSLTMQNSFVSLTMGDDGITIKSLMNLISRGEVRDVINILKENSYSVPEDDVNMVIAIFNDMPHPVKHIVYCASIEMPDIQDILYIFDDTMKDKSESKDRFFKIKWLEIARNEIYNSNIINGYSEESNYDEYLGLIKYLGMCPHKTIYFQEVATSKSKNVFLTIDPVLNCTIVKTEDRDCEVSDPWSRVGKGSNERELKKVLEFIANHSSKNEAERANLFTLDELIIIKHYTSRTIDSVTNGCIKRDGKEVYTLYNLGAISDLGGIIKAFEEKYRGQCKITYTSSLLENEKFNVRSHDIISNPGEQIGRSL